MLVGRIILEVREAYGFTTKEVILAAGATQTPQILELSGIGSADLWSHGNITIIDNPHAGENL